MRLLLVTWLAVACTSGPSSLRNAAAPDATTRHRDAAALGLGELGPHVADLVTEAYRGSPRRTDRPGPLDPPFLLQPADGTELALRRLRAEIQIRGPLAHTEIHVAFRNTEHRQREGRFILTLPDGATVDRFAMKIGPAWRDARVVSRRQGRAEYQMFLQAGVDPALLERDADQRYTARVFPIAADGDVELIVAYDHAVGPQRPYALRLRGLPAVPVAIAIDRDGEIQRRSSSDAPADVVIDIPGGDAAIAAGAVFAARIGTAAAGPPAALDRVLVLVDTSASRAPIMLRQAEAVRGLLGALPAEAEVAVAVFDQAVRELYRGPAAGAGRASAAILAHGALGASRLAAALRYAAAAGLPRVIVVSDAVATLGERDPARLAQIAGDDAIDRIDVIQLGTEIDLAAARAIAGAGRQPGAVIDGRDLDRAMHQLALAIPATETISVQGADVWPETTRGIAPGDPILVYGRYIELPPGAVPPSTIEIRIGERTQELVAQTGDARWVERAVASAQLTAREDQLAIATELAATERSAAELALTELAATVLRGEIEQLAMDHQLASSQTSLVVFTDDAHEQWMLAQGAPPAVVEPLSDEELARLTEEESEDEVILITGSIDDGSALREQGAPPPGVPTCTYESRGIPPSRGEPSPQVPSIIESRDRTPYAPPDPSAPAPPWLGPSPYAGALREVMAAIGDGDRDDALDRAVRAWRTAPGEIAALLALGEALEARGATALAARAYGSIIDLYPSRDPLVLATGERLDRIGGAARELAVEAYRRAAREQPQRVEGQRRLGYALARQGHWDDAVDAMADALTRALAQASGDAAEVLRRDLGVVAAAAIAADPRRAALLTPRLAGFAVALPTRPSLRFVVSWETNRFDLHVRDQRGAEACRWVQHLPSGGQLHGGRMEGFGPAMFEIAAPAAFPYRIAAHADRYGQGDIALGAVQIIRYDGRGGLAIEDRPFAIQTRGAMIDLGAVREH